MVSQLLAHAGTYGEISQMSRSRRVSRQTFYAWKQKGQRALEAAADGYDRIKRRERGKLTYAEWREKQPDGMPIPARKAKRAFTVKAANDNLPLTTERTTTEVAA